MRFVVLNTDYPPFLEQLYQNTPGLGDEPFERQMLARMDTLFGVADFYSHALRQLGHEAVDIHFNNGRAQQAWGKRHGVAFTAPGDARRDLFPWNPRMQPGRWEYDIVAAQLKQLRPDVLLMQAMDAVKPEALRALKPYAGLLVGQHASPPLPEEEAWTVYDMAVSSFLPRVEWFRAKGLRAGLNRLAFDGRVAEAVVGRPRDIAVSFVGAFFDMHTSRTALLEQLARRVPLKVWGMAPKEGFGDSPLAACYQGSAWGREMYGVLARSKIVINHHGNVPDYANNLRLFESTGMGAMLLTDAKSNLQELFDVGREAVSYRSAEECAEKIQYYLSHEEERAAIAEAGRQRTLRDHTFRNRMEELIAMLPPPARDF